MKSIRIAIYAAISVHFIRALARKVLSPAPKLIMPPVIPGEEQEDYTIGAMVSLSVNEYTAFMLKGATTATLDFSQLNWFHANLFRLSRERITEADIRLVAWPASKPREMATPEKIAKMLDISPEARESVAKKLESLVHMFNEAVRQ